MPEYLQLRLSWCTNIIWGKSLLGLVKWANTKNGDPCGWSLVLYFCSFDQVKLYSTHIRYNQIKNYDYDNPGFSPNTGSFTQVIWAKSSEIGCARCSGLFNAGYETYVICKYFPSGNVKGQFEANVPPPLIN